MKLLLDTHTFLWFIDQLSLLAFVLPVPFARAQDRLRGAPSQASPACGLFDSAVYAARLRSEHMAARWHSLCRAILMSYGLIEEKESTMRWSEIRQVYPNQWLIVEALEAHTTPDKRRHLDCLAILETCPDGSVALQRYRHLHQQYPRREFYFVHTSREDLDIHERVWLGVRRSHAVNAER